MEKNKEKIHQDMESKNAYDLAMKKIQIKLDKEEERKKRIKKNKGKITCLFLSFLTVASLLDYGFFTTLLIWIIMLIGYFAGSWIDKDPKVLKFLIRLIKKFQ